jgi:hypothetical protein
VPDLRPIVTTSQHSRSANCASQFNVSQPKTCSMSELAERFATRR